MTRIRAMFDVEDAFILLGATLLFIGLFWIHPPLAFVVAGGIILLPRFLKYIPRRKGS